jgi:hypothetical protein
VSFQITVLKVLEGYPDGRAAVAELKSAVTILMCSGSEWTTRTRRLAALRPDLDIFSEGYVLRDEAGWSITEAGRAFLVAAEASVQAGPQEEPATLPSAPTLPPVRTARSRRRRSRRRSADKRSAVA